MTDLLIDRASETITASMESLLGQAADDFTQRLNRGEQPDIEEYASRYPQIAPLLRQVLPALQMLRVPAADSGEGIQPQGTLGDFCIHREIGRGGMGVVYEAEQISLGRRVALKVLPFAAALDSKQLQRFKNEAHAAAHLQHQNIVPVYAVGCERGVHFYAMQFVEGQTLAALIRDLRQIEGRNGEAGTPAYPAEPRPLRSGEAESLEKENQARQQPRPPEDLASELVSGRWAGAMLSPGHPCADLSSSEAEARRKHATPCATGPFLPSPPPDQTPQAVTVTPPVGALSTEHSTSRPAFFRTVANLGIQAAEALEHAHSLGVIHRDIKPGNLMVDARGNLWITDFGLAHCQGAVELTMSGDLLGTLRYMSPEQALAQRVLVDQRTDIYSLGATLYELLTLEPAFPGRDRAELLRQIAFDDPKPLRRVSKAIPAELETIVLKAMEKNPADRYATAQEFADDFRRYLENRPIRARRPSILAQLRKWSWRHRAVVTAALLATVLALALTSGLTAWQWRLAVNAKEAEGQRAEGERQAKDEAQAVLDFVEHKIFAAAQPEDQEGGLGRDVTLRKAVETALPFVEKSFRNQPLIQARLRLTLGVAFLQLGDAKTAAEQSEAARALYTQHIGPDHPDTLRSMHNLAESYRHLGRYADSLKLNEETLALRQANLGPDHPDTLSSMNNLAKMYYELGRYADSLKLNEETLALRQANLAPDHPDTLSSMNNLASSYYALGRYADALKLYEETLALRQAKLAPDHADTLSTMGNLANVYGYLGRRSDALKLREETLKLLKAKLGPDHLDTLGSMFNLANSYADLGRYTDAVNLYEETLAVLKAKVPDNALTFNCMTGLANSYRALGRHADALKLYEETLALQKAKLGPDHSDTLMSMMNLASGYGALGRHPDALKLHEETLALRQANLGPYHPETLLSMWGVADSLVQLNRGAEAVPIIDECVRRAADKVVDPRLLPEVMGLRVQHFEKTKDAAGCRQTAEMWEKLNRADADSLYNAACFRAVTAAVLRGTDLKSVRQPRDADAEAERAMTWLKQAVVGGFKNAAHMKKDKDLDALRQREDFKGLLGELEKKPPPPELLPSGDSKK